MPADAQFWIMAGDVPAGPYPTADVFAKLAAGEVGWDTPACPVGGVEWRPLSRTPGIGPDDSLEPVTPAVSEMPPEPPPSVSSTASSPKPTPSAGTPDGNTTPEWVGVAVGIGIIVVVAAALLIGLGYGVYGLYEWVRPYTPTEVCARMAEAKTAADMKRYTTPRMHSLIDAIFADGSGDDPDETFELLPETYGPTPTVKFVGYRGLFFDPVVGQRIKMEGQFRLVLSSGWKVDDMTIRTYDGAALPQPMSLVDAQLKSTNQFALSKPLTTPPIQGKGPWGILTSIWNFYGVIGIVVLVVVGGVIAAIVEGQKKSKGTG